MAKIKVRTLADAPRCAPDADERASPGVVTTGVLTGAADPLHLRLHHLADGASLRWRASRRGHLAFVWEGAVRVAGHRLEAGSMILAEHAAGTVAVAEGPAALLVFTVAASVQQPVKAGGHVHLLPAAAVPRIARLGGAANVGAAIYADSDCASCDLWLHGNDFHDGDFAVSPHLHSEDEVIVVTGGTIVLGRRSFGRGTAIAIAADTIYGFRTVPDGLAFINFRPGRPSYGQPGGAGVRDERGFYTAIPAPAYLDADRPGQTDSVATASASRRRPSA